MDSTALKLDTTNIKIVAARIGNLISWRGLIWNFWLAAKSKERRQGTKVVRRIPALGLKVKATIAGEFGPRTVQNTADKECN
jgi:hypothetical protein